MVETFFKTIKSDLVSRTDFYPATKPQAIACYIDGFYNPVRRLRSTTSALRSSNELRHAEQTPLHFTRASPDRSWRDIMDATGCS
jgi:hypothetical protein